MIFLILSIIIIIVQVIRCSIFILRKDVNLFKKCFEVIVLLMLIVLEYYNFQYNKSAMYVSSVILLYILVSYIYEYINSSNYISALSVKKGIDMSNAGVMFLDNDGSIILINDLFSGVLKYYGITEYYINNLISVSFKMVGSEYLLKYNNKVYCLKIVNDLEVSLIDIDELYKLQIEEEKYNKEINENNKKLLLTVNNIKKIEKEKNLLKLKNEYHDIIGYRLALFDKYLESSKTNSRDILFLLDSIYVDFDSSISSNDKLSNLVRMYSIIGINVNVIGELPKNIDVSKVFFEVIRESVTNAIIHASSKNINVVITKYLSYVEMIITNDGKKPDNIIFESDGIKGMKRRVSSINGSISIDIVNGFKISVRV